ncbi:alpha/beta hydrolase [Pedobacter sp. Du54]|uniref:alpha/beta hydrolase n=1 Tax=Pedobacter anseongensis TaxID=3133439 RepID=UPI0030A0C8EB
MKSIFKFALILLFLGISLPSCKKDSPVITDPVIKVEAQTLLDVSYGNSSSQKMDVYLPANRSSSTKVIIFIHGGSFISGDKSDFTFLVKELVRANFAVLNVNYRLVDATGLYDTPVKHMESAVKIKDQVTDISTIVNYVLSNAKEWQVSETKLGLAGHSAGATLSLLYGYDALNAGKVKAIANLAGALDQTFIDIPFYNFLLPAGVLEAGYRYTGYEVGPTTDIYYRAISPLYVANASQKIPTLTIFPELNDVGGLPKQNRATFDAFTAKLNSLGVPNKFVQVAGADHEFSKSGNIDLVLKETIDYFNANLK